MENRDTENQHKASFATSQPRYLQKGLTKREYFAGQALQGLTVQAIPGGYNSNSPHNNSYIARHAVAMADALLEELER